MSQHSDRPAPASAAVVLAVLGSVDWIAYLALRSAGPAVCAAIIGALTTLALALGRACSRLLGPGRDEQPPR
jgi:hypothetical protein